MLPTLLKLNSRELRLENMPVFFPALQAALQFVYLEMNVEINVKSIQDNIRLKRSHTKQSCAHEIIQLNNMHGTKHTTEFV